MSSSSAPGPARRWGERLVLALVVLAGFGIGTAGLALVGQRWHDDPLVLEEPVSDAAADAVPVDDAEVAVVEAPAEPIASEPTQVVPEEAPSEIEAERRPRRGDPRPDLGLQRARR